ncbi:hypothetical protein Ga0074812_11632 [Parafrankia irregularis]|uniref:DUF5134 domain-containing protein n=1 Tax=Parafrankia irregularis TaxID=795642 RepID=A0A0S4QRP6_9ACTN|nr:DUF5134 domain-containing protein [Parafrankia sp. CH37]CUU58004.1 hypothetical protein Ga0074812_11632 [Parafrankia irregularis]
MTGHPHSVAAELGPLPGPVTAVAAAAAAVVAAVHLVRLYGLLRSTPAGRLTLGHPVAGHPAEGHPVAGHTVADGWIEVAHVLVAAGMAVMFVGPPRLIGAWPFFAVYLALALVMLAMVVLHPHCGTPGVWSCCAMVVVESAAMACMSGAVGFAGWPLRTDGALGAWCVAVFAGACLVALVGLPARWAARTSARRITAWLVRAFPDPVVPRGTRLVMSGGMVLMFLGHV